MADATFSTPDLTTFARLDGLGLQVTGQFLEPDRAVLACRVGDSDDTCRRCGQPGRPRDSTTRRLAHEPFGWRPTILLVTVRRYRCDGCRHVWRQDMSAAAEPRARLSRGGLRWALTALVCQHLTVSRIAEALGVSWNTANDAVLAEGRRVLICDPARFDGVRVIGVEHTRGHRGRAGDPPYSARRTLSTGADLLTDKQRQRISALFADDAHLEVEATWGVYQAMIGAYRDPDRASGKSKMQKLIDTLGAAVPAGLVEIRTLGRTLKKRAGDILAYFDRPGTSNVPTEAINGRLEHLRGSALGFRNLTNYIAKSLLETGGFRPGLHLRLR